MQPTQASKASSNQELLKREQAKSEQTKPEEQSTEAPESKRVYYFQHRLLPEWTFDSASADVLFTDLMEGELTKLQSVAAEIISESYASEMTSKYYSEHKAALITFPTPTSFTNCFFILIKKGESGYRFYTYEKTLSFSEDDPVKGVVGHWSKDGGHGNLGGRTYTTADEFVNDLMK